MIDEENGQTRKTKGGKKYQKKQKGKKGKIAGIIVAIILILFSRWLSSLCPSHRIPLCTIKILFFSANLWAIS